ncbi:membrane metallo-endopeptidase-like 1 [Uloborus diversus]|uniref:membrane metallo-endopeptidase-like 1 n=1 Tax=Uloborus diversus TaxID=327109 RepID=UPI00240A6995|nr:membrane metallo-endopeptidase-like 1 [Uloborus diversus]
MSLQKRTIYFACSLLIVLFVVVAYILYLRLVHEGYYRNSDQQILNYEALISQCHPVCASKQCTLDSHFIRSNINESANPCEDFYSFSCGKWMARYGEEDNYSLFERVDSSLKRIIKGILEDTKGELSTSSMKMKIMYDSCIRESSSETEPVSSMLNFLNKTGIYNWPHLLPYFEFEQGLEKTLSLMAKILMEQDVIILTLL